MPRRDDIQSILIIGAGPIIIGQACEFDYSGAQACKALREEGYRIILVNSNPATIMTDPGMADATYIEPITPVTVARIIEAERPDALLPTMGGQTALNTALALDKQGTLDKFGVEMIGARPESIEKAENRELFRVAMKKIGLQCARARTVNNFEDAPEALDFVGLPAIIRPSFTLGGEGGGVADDEAADGREAVREVERRRVVVGAEAHIDLFGVGRDDGAARALAHDVERDAEPDRLPAHRREPLALGDVLLGVLGLPQKHKTP